jgi:hypothetical protein
MRSIPYPRRRTAISRLLPLFLLIGSTTLSAQSQGSSPLNSEEKRQILVQLLELKSCRAEVSAYEDHIRRERQLADRALELERQATALAGKERDLALEKAAMYEQLYNSVKPRKTTFGCVLKTIFSAGLYRCR